MKNVLVATGTSPNKLKKTVGIIQDYANKKGAAIEVTGINIYDMKADAIDADLIVAIGPINFKTDIPIIQGMAFLTGVGTDKCCDEILSTLS